MSQAVSVIIPTYNCGHHIAEAVESALAQSYEPLEIIVVDDGSRDDTARRLNPFVARGVQYLFQPNQGVSVARNNGIRATHGDLVAFLDADDVWHPRKLELQCRVLSSRPDFSMLGTAVYNWPGATPQVCDSRVEDLRQIPWTELAVKNWFTTSSVVVRRSALLLSGPGPFDISLRGPEDYDLWLRLAELRTVANLQIPLTGYRCVKGSLGKQARTMEVGLRRVLLKLDERGSWGRTGNRLLRRKAHAYVRYSCGCMFGEAGDRMMAIWRLIQSVVGYPFPFASGEVRTRFARPKLLAASSLGLIVGGIRNRDARSSSRKP
jgi:glycosyltransferase involved in cell wall biosynthesis